MKMMLGLAAADAAEAGAAEPTATVAKTAIIAPVAARRDERRFMRNAGRLRTIKWRGRITSFVLEKAQPFSTGMRRGLLLGTIFLFLFPLYLSLSSVRFGTGRPGRSGSDPS